MDPEVYRYLAPEEQEGYYLEYRPDEDVLEESSRDEDEQDESSLGGEIQLKKRYEGHLEVIEENTLKLLEHRMGGYYEMLKDFIASISNELRKKMSNAIRVSNKNEYNIKSWFEEGECAAAGSDELKETLPALFFALEQWSRSLSPSELADLKVL